MFYNRYFFIELLNDQDIDLGLAWWIDFFIISFLLFGISILLTVASKLIVRGFLKKLSKRTKSHIDDYLLSSKFPLYFSRIVPYFFLLSVVPFWIVDSPSTTSVILTSLNVYGAIVTIWIFRSILQTLRSFLLTLDSFKDNP